MNTKTENSIIPSYVKGDISLSLNAPLKNSANPPKRSLLEEIGNSITHGLGSIFSIVALAAVITKGCG